MIFSIKTLVGAILYRIFKPQKALTSDRYGHSIQEEVEHYVSVSEALKECQCYGCQYRRTLMKSKEN